MKNEGDTIRLVSSNEPPPAELESVLKELGAGDARFQGRLLGGANVICQLSFRNVAPRKMPGKLPPTEYRNARFGW
jgi:hypothetical protein